MNKREKVIVTITFPLVGVVCLIVGGYIGTKWGSAISESPVIIANHDRYQGRVCRWSVFLGKSRDREDLVHATFQVLLHRPENAGSA